MVQSLDNALTSHCPAIFFLILHVLDVCACIHLHFMVITQMKFSLFMPPLKKGTYCFATVGRWVGMSVCWSVDQVFSAKISFDPFT